MKTETERKCPNCRHALDRGMWFWICICCHFAESLETGIVDNPGKPQRLPSLPNADVMARAEQSTNSESE